MKNKMSKIMKSLACVGIAVSLIAITSCDTKGSIPMLKITTTTSYGIFPATKTDYYIIYENGATKKTSKFVTTDVPTYFFIDKVDDKYTTVLSDLDINSPEGEKLKEVAFNILLLLDKTKFEIISVNALYVLGDRYFFDILTDNGAGPISNKLFEYVYGDNSIKEIVSFNSKGINHIELYKS